MMSRGLRPALSKASAASPARRQSSFFSWLMAIWAELLGQAHAERFNRGRHRVGGVHATAGARTGNGAILDFFETLIVEFMGCVLADGFEDRNDVAFLLRVRMDAGEDGAAVDEHAGTIQAGERHHAAGHVFVATADGDEGVKSLGTGDGLDGVGDHLAGNEGVTHAGCAHADSIGNGDGAKNDRLAARGVGTRGGVAGELVDVHIARSDHAPGGGHAHDRFLEIFVLEADGPEHGPIRCAVGTVEHDGGMLAEGGGRGAHGQNGDAAHQTRLGRASPSSKAEADGSSVERDLRAR